MSPDVEANEEGEVEGKVGGEVELQAAMRRWMSLRRRMGWAAIQS